MWETVQRTWLFQHEDSPAQAIGADSTLVDRAPQLHDSSGMFETGRRMGGPYYCKHSLASNLKVPMAVVCFPDLFSKLLCLLCVCTLKRPCLLQAPNALSSFHLFWAEVDMHAWIGALL